MERRTEGVEPGARRGRARRALLAAIALAGAASSARAQQVSGYAELIAAQSDADSEDAIGRRTATESDSFLQRYGVDWSWRPYPNLQVLAGGLFERDAVTTGDDIGTLDATQRKIHPYLNALLRTAIFSGQAGYYRNEDSTFTDGSAVNNLQEIYNTTFGWRPRDRPSLVLRFIRTNTTGAGGLTQDTTDDLVDLVSEYQPAPSLQLYYRGAYQSLKDRLQAIDVSRTTHSGRVTYGDSFWDRRVQVGAEYDVNDRETEVEAGGIGEVVSPLFPIAGLSSITDTPADGALLPNPGLVDEDRTASAGINLGLPPLGGDDRPRNMGLDFGGPTTVDTLYVWVDRVLPLGISASFAWDVYTSADNLTWVLQAPPVSVGFGTFETRFEIRFGDLTARYVKAVTRPLARTVPSADQFPDILVTEITAARRTPAAEAIGRTRLTQQFLTTSVRARLRDRPGLYYEMSYFARDTGPSPVTYTLSNGLSVQHAFNPRLSATARAAREDSRESEGSRLSYLYTASLRAVPIPTLLHSVVWSGRTSEIAGRSSRTNSVYLYNSAELYRGVNATLGLGLSSADAESGERTDTTQINTQATLVPHATTTLNLLYQSSRGTRKGGALVTDERLRASAAQASLTYRPLTTLYFFFSYRLEDNARAGDRFLRNYSVGWSPFPDGSLQVLLRFDETYSSDLDSLSRISSPRVRWNITDRWYVEVAYERSVFDTAVDARTADTYTASMRIWF